MTSRPVPLEDRDSAPWWRALGRHELLVQACNGCGVRRWPPRALCSRCADLSWQWVPAKSTGAVASWIVNHHAFITGLEAPYVVVLVALDDADDILVPGGWGGSQDGSDLRIGLPVQVGYDDVDGTTLLRWEPGPG